MLTKNLSFQFRDTLKGFYESGKDLSKFPMIQKISSLDEIKNGDCILIVRGIKKDKFDILSEIVLGHNSKKYLMLEEAVITNYEYDKERMDVVFGFLKHPQQTSNYSISYRDIEIENVYRITHDQTQPNQPQNQNPAK